MAMNRTLLFIGFGYVARATAPLLAQAGWRVRASARSPETVADIEQAGFEAAPADPQDRDGAAALRRAACEADALISSVPPGPHGDPVLRALEGFEPEGRWLGYLSTTGVYGDRKGGWAFEWEAPSPGQARSVRRAQAEEGWTRLGARLFRLSGIYGPGRSAFDRLRGGRRVVFDKPGQVFSRIHVSDIAAALLAALERPHAQGPFNLADDYPCSQAEIMTGAAAMAGLPAPDIRPFDPEAASEMQASFFAECRRVSNARAKAALGWRPACPDWRAGLEAILQSEASMTVSGGDRPG